MELRSTIFPMGHVNVGHGWADGLAEALTISLAAKWYDEAGNPLPLPDYHCDASAINDVAEILESSAECLSHNIEAVGALLSAVKLDAIDELDVTNAGHLVRGLAKLQHMAHQYAGNARYALDRHQCAGTAVTPWEALPTGNAVDSPGNEVEGAAALMSLAHAVGALGNVVIGPDLDNDVAHDYHAADALVRETLAKYANDAGFQKAMATWLLVDTGGCCVSWKRITPEELLTDEGNRTRFEEVRGRTTVTTVSDAAEAEAGARHAKLALVTMHDNQGEDEFDYAGMGDLLQHNVATASRRRSAAYQRAFFQALAVWLTPSFARSTMTVELDEWDATNDLREAGLIGESDDTPVRPQQHQGLTLATEMLHALKAAIEKKAEPDLEALACLLRPYLTDALGLPDLPDDRAWGFVLALTQALAPMAARDLATWDPLAPLVNGGSLSPEPGSASERAKGAEALARVVDEIDRKAAADWSATYDGTKDVDLSVDLDPRQYATMGQMAIEAMGTGEHRAGYLALLGELLCCYRHGTIIDLWAARKTPPAAPKATKAKRKSRAKVPA